MRELVVDLWEPVPGAAGHVGADRAGVVQAAAEAAWLAGEQERGFPLVGAEVAGLGAEGDADGAGSLLRLRAALRQQLLLPGQLDDLRVALRLAAGPTRARAQVLGRLARALMLRDRVEEARSLATELQVLAAGLGDEGYRIEAKICLAQLSRGEGDIIPGLADAAQRARPVAPGPLQLLSPRDISTPHPPPDDHV